MSSRSVDRMEAPELRERIIAQAARLVAEGGVAALTTRAVAAAASVQAPTLYRLFQDKRGLLDAVAEHGLAAFIAQKAAVTPDPDPVQDLRQAWDSYIAFGLENPAVFAIMHEIRASGLRSPAADTGLDILRKRIARIARAGRLRVPEAQAVALVHAAGAGVIMTLLALPEQERNAGLSLIALDAVIGKLVSEGSAGDDVPVLAVGLLSHLDGVAGLTPGERLMLGELLGRLASVKR